MYSGVLPGTLTLLTAFSHRRANKANTGDTIEEREHMAAIARAVLGFGGYLRMKKDGKDGGEG